MSTTSTPKKKPAGAKPANKPATKPETPAAETSAAPAAPAEKKSAAKPVEPPALPAAQVAGRVDNITRRDDNDVLQGHFCVIDYSDPDVVKAVKEQLAPKGSPLAEQGFEPGLGSADYGVYNHPGEVGEDGYPVTAVVTLRDEYACMVTVPYSALRPSVPGRR